MNTALSSLGLVALAVASVEGLSVPRQDQGFKYLVAFGDSYTDNGRGNYIGLNGGQPPAGTLHPETNVTASGGLTWTQYVGNYTGATVYDYAVGGATCSNKIVPKGNPFVGIPIPAVLDDQVPAYQADSDTDLYGDVTADNAVYAVWIGTNDLGIASFLTDSQNAGTNLTSYVDCLWSSFDGIYQGGGRRFVIMNNNALSLAPEYQVPEKGGLGNNIFWGDKENYNMTEYNQKMFEYVATLNRVIDYGVPFNLMVQNRWPDASFAVYDVYSLVEDIYNNPEAYLEAPYNATGPYYDYTSDPAPGTNLNSYLWYDLLHPSNQTDTHIAKEFIKVAAGESEYGRYWNY